MTIENWESYLTNEQVEALTDVIVEAGLSNDATRKALLGSLSNRYTSRIPHDSGLSERARLVQTIRYLSRTSKLTNGSIPLLEFLTQSEQAMPDVRHKEIVEQYQKIVHDNPAPEGLILVPAQGSSSNKRLWVIVVAALVTCGLIYAAYKYYSGATSSTIYLKSSLLTINDQGVIAESEPFDGAQLTVHPANFDNSRVVTSKTNSQGESTLQIEHDSETVLKGHFLVSGVPTEHEANKPFVTTQHGAIKQGAGLRLLRIEPRTLRDGDRIDLQIIPEKDVSRFYLTAIARATVQPRDVETQLTDFDASIRDAALASWNTSIRLERPILLLDDISKHNNTRWQSLQTISTLFDSVGYIRDSRRPDQPFLGTAFVVAPDTVVTSSHIQSGDQIVFGEDASSQNNESYEIGRVLYRSDNHEVMVLDVPGIDRTPLLLETKNPFDVDTSDIAVIGYPTSDPGGAEEANALLDGITTAKRIMPGEVLGLRNPGELTNSSRESPHLTYDASTNPGTSGAPVVNLSNRFVSAIHQSGVWEGERKVGQGVPTWEVLKDKDLVELLKARGAKLVFERTMPSVNHAYSGAGYDPEFLPGTKISLPLPVTTPAPETLEKLTFEYPNFSILMNPSTSLAWVTAANVDRANLKRVQRRNSFFVDERGPKSFQRTGLYYKNNEWDRGHVVARSSVAWGSASEAELASSAAFAYTNITPQHSNFNRGVWLRLEQAVLSEIEPDIQRLNVFAGPVFSNSDVVYKGLKIPSAFWKVAVFHSEESSKLIVRAWIVNQYESIESQAVPLSPGSDLASFEVTLEEVERVAKIRFSGVD